MTLPRIGITIGDPGGVGPEIVLKTWSGDYQLPAADYVLFSSGPVLTAEEKALGVHFDFETSKTGRAGLPGTLTLRELPSSLKSVTKGAPSAKNGRESFNYFKTAVAEAREGKLDAVVTAPISKSSWALAGIPWKGHTDYLSQFYVEFSSRLSLKSSLRVFSIFEIFAWSSIIFSVSILRSSLFFGLRIIIRMIARITSAMQIVKSVVVIEACSYKFI